MTVARSQQINLEATTYYHCMAKCVRRGFLLGQDSKSKKNYMHRKKWIIEQLKKLSSVFAMRVCAYAIMSNHYHVVLKVEDKVALSWSNNEVVERWSQLYPKSARESAHQPDKIMQWRMRLMDISWFMKCLNEHIATRANKEDKVDGRFWNGRFKSQALLDEGAVLCAMVYVDLNPIRQGLATTPEDSEFTSIFDRIKAAVKHISKNPSLTVDKNDFQQPQHLLPLSTHANDASLDISPKDYIELVDYSGRMICEDKPCAIPAHLAPILEGLKVKTHQWKKTIKMLIGRFYYAIGSPDKLNLFSKSHQRTIKGLSVANIIYH